LSGGPSVSASVPTDGQLSAGLAGLSWAEVALDDRDLFWSRLPGRVRDHFQLRKLKDDPGFLLGNRQTNAGEIGEPTLNTGR
jgi:hypothetical protein